MTLIALTSPGDAPGATTTAFALALALTWPQRVLLAECSPAGGRLLRGYFEGQVAPDRGLWNVGLAALGGPEAATRTLWEQTIALDPRRRRLLLAGVEDPFMAVQFTAATWQTLAEMFTGLPDAVLADVGPITPEAPFPLLRAAGLVLVVMRPTLAQVLAARPRLARLQQALAGLPRRVPIGLCLIGERPYTAAEVRARLGDLDLLLTLPSDERSARVLSDGGGGDRLRRRIENGPLLRQAAMAAKTAHRFLTDQQQTLHTAVGPVALEDTRS